MKYLILIFALLLVGCDCNNSKLEKENRFTLERYKVHSSNTCNSKYLDVITDKESGVQYLSDGNWVIELKKPVEKF